MSTNTLPLPSPALAESRRIHALAQTDDPRAYEMAHDALLNIAAKRIRSVIAEMASKNDSWIDRAELESVMLDLALRQAERYLANPTPTASFETYIFHGLRKRALEAVQQEANHWRGRVAAADPETGVLLIENSAGIDASAEDRCAESAEVISLFDRAGLNASAREILMRHDGLGETHREIADTFGRPLNTVKSDYRRALARVQAVTA